MWNKIMGRVMDSLPKFNDDLIYGFRKRKLGTCGEFLDHVQRQNMVFFNNQMTYIGHRVLTPEERIAYLIENPITDGAIPIRQNEISILQFEYRFEGMPYFSHIAVPYLFHDRIIYNDSNYFPQIVLVEKGGINRTRNGTIIMKVLRVPMTFGRREENKLRAKAMSGRVYWDLLVTAKIHMGNKGGKRGERIPLILYHLCKWGFPVTMVRYGFNVGDIEIVTELPEGHTPEDEFEYFMMDRTIKVKSNKKITDVVQPPFYLKVRRVFMKDIYKRRIVLSLLKIFDDNRRYKLNDLIQSDSGYYKVTLGDYIGTTTNKTNILLYGSAEKHLRMTDPLLDGVAKQQLASINIHVEDIYDLLYWFFYEIDNLLVTYNPSNFYDKKIGSLEQIMSWVVRNIATRQYRIINSKKEGLTDRVVSKFVKSSSQQASWIGKVGMFRANPALYNDNFILQIGLKRVLSLDNFESSDALGATATRIPIEELRVHPSHLTISAIHDIPSSNPVVSGSMNPFTQIDEDGNIIKPPYAKEVEHVFDRANFEDPKNK